MSEEPEKFRVDRTGVVMIAALGLVITPVLMLGAVYKLSEGLAFEGVSAVEWVFIGLTVGLVAVGISGVLSASELASQEAGRATGLTVFTRDELAHASIRRRLF